MESVLGPYLYLSPDPSQRVDRFDENIANSENASADKVVVTV